MCPVGISHVFSNVLCYSFFSKVLREWSLDTRKLVQCVCFTNTRGARKEFEAVDWLLCSLVKESFGQNTALTVRYQPCWRVFNFTSLEMSKQRWKWSSKSKAAFFYTFNLSNVKCGGFWDWQLSYFFLESYSLHHHTKPFWRNIIVLWPFNISPFRFIRWLPHLMMDGGSK